MALVSLRGITENNIISNKKTLKEISSGEYKTNPEETQDESEESAENDETNTVEAKAEADSNESDNTENETSDENEEEKKDTQKKITFTIDDNQLITTSFDDPIENGALNLSMNKATNDVDSINNTLKSASTISSILKSGTMPLEYEIKNLIVSVFLILYFDINSKLFSI